MFVTSTDVLSLEAARYYNRPIPGAGVLWSYFRFDQLTLVARAIGRPIEAPELRLLVEIDGNFSATCHCCRKKFTPINWVDIDPIIDILWNQKKGSLPLAIAQAEPRRFGPFYRQGREIIAFCGKPWFRDVDGHYVRKTMSHIVYYAYGPRTKKGWGTTRYFAQNPPACKTALRSVRNPNIVVEEMRELAM